ncbi:hypothetical protein O6482_24040, partial [Salmonella enterica subsp. enterica]
GVQSIRERKCLALIINYLLLQRSQMLKAGVFGKTGETCGESRTGRRNRGRRDLIIKCRVLPIGLRFLRVFKQGAKALLKTDS